MITLTYYLLLGTILFFIGMSGILTQKNFIKFLMCVEIAINGINLNLAAIASFFADASGQTFVMFIIAISAVEIAVGLALSIVVYRKFGNIDIDTLMESMENSNEKYNHSN